MKRILSFVLIWTMVVLLFAACGTEKAADSSVQESVSAETAPEETQEVTAAPVSEEPVSVVEESVSVQEPEMPAYFPLAETKSFSYWFTYPPMFDGYAEAPMDYLMYQEAQKRLNVSIDWTAVPIPAANEQFMLMISGGDYTDAMFNFTTLYSGSLDEAISQEVIIDLTEPLESYAPDYMATRAKSETRILSSLTESGNQAVMYGFQTMEGRVPKFGAVIRQDWLDQLGLDSPVTVEDYHDVLTAFQQELGVAAPYGLASDGVTTPGNLQGAYDIIVPSNNDTNGFYQIDGTVHFGPTEDAFCDMLTTLNTWYQEGLIDSDFVSDSNSGVSGEVSSDRIANGEVGIWRGYATNLSNYESNIGGSAKVTGIAPMRMTDASTLHFGMDADNAAFNMGISVSTQCDDVELVVRFFNYFFTEEGSLLANYGTEGFTFEYNEAGDPVYTEVITNNPDGMTMDMALCLYTGGSTGGPYEIDNSKNFYTYTEAQMDAAQIWMEGTDGAYQLPDTYTNLMSSTELEELNGYYNDIITTYKEAVLQFITGAKPISDFDSFRSQIESMGIPRCIEIVQDALDRYYARSV